MGNNLFFQQYFHDNHIFFATLRFILSAYTQQKFYFARVNKNSKMMIGPAFYVTVNSLKKLYVGNLCYNLCLNAS